MLDSSNFCPLLILIKFSFTSDNLFFGDEKNIFRSKEIIYWSSLKQIIKRKQDSISVIGRSLSYKYNFKDNCWYKLSPFQIYFYMPSNATIDRNGKTSMIMIPAKNYEHPSLAYIDLGIVRLILIDSSNNGQLEFVWTGDCSIQSSILVLWYK